MTTCLRALSRCLPSYVDPRQDTYVPALVSEQADRQVLPIQLVDALQAVRLAVTRLRKGAITQATKSVLVCEQVRCTGTSSVPTVHIRGTLLWLCSCDVSDMHTTNCWEPKHSIARCRPAYLLWLGHAACRDHDGTLLCRNQREAGQRSPVLL